MAAKRRDVATVRDKPPTPAGAPRTKGPDFIRAMVAEDTRTGKYGGRVVTRFPPEPNGYLHIGHAKSCCLNFGLAAESGGVCHLRFDDTNPETEDLRYVEAIKLDVQWLGFDWGDKLFHAADYFERLYEHAAHLIEKGRAYVDSLSEEEIREYRGTVTEAGRASPYRDRPVEENLDLFRRMRAGEFADGTQVLRAKIDMAHPNMLMRDPVLYRIRHAQHYRRGDAWCIYPLYDFTHCLSDAIENITHSLCTLEFKDNNALYEWVLDAADIPHPRPAQTEFARLNHDYTVLSKRKLVRLVEEGHVSGWDDPRMPTIAGLRRRGVTPEAIRAFCDMIGVAKVDSRVDIEKFEYAVRDDLNKRVPRVLCVLRPLKLVIVNYPEGQVEELEAPYYPRDVPKEGSRKVPFSRELYIERDDFLEAPPKGFFRLAPGREVRLRYAYLVKCVDVVKDEQTGDVVEVHCTYDAETRGGSAPDGRKVKGTLHWVSAAQSLPADVRLYDRLFSVPNPDDVEPRDFTDHLNRDSLVVLHGSRIEPSVARHTRLYPAAVQNDQRVAVEVVGEVPGLYIVGVGHAEQPVVEPHVRRQRLRSRYPVQRPLHLTPVRSRPSARFGIVGAVHFDHISGLLVFHDIHAFHQVCVPQPYLTSGRQPKEPLGWRLEEVVALNVQLARERHLPRALFGHVTRIIGRFQLFYLAFRIVHDNQLERSEHAQHARHPFVQIVTNGIFELFDVHSAVDLGDTNHIAERTDRFGGDPAPPEPRYRGHARVVPAGDVPLLHQPHQLPFAEDGVVVIEPGELGLRRPGMWDIRSIEYPLVQRVVVLELQRAQ